MSSTLMWRPVEATGGTFSRELKRVLDKNGWSTGRFDRKNIDYLKGVADCGVDEAQELIDLILEHDEIELWLE